MPTLITHSMVGLASAAAVSNRAMPKRFWILSILCAVIPDADVAGFRLGIPYAHFFGHRGFFHSVFFACLLGLLAGSLCWRREKASTRSWWLHAGYFSLVAATHGLLDACTNGGLGIALLSPFRTERYFFPATPIEVAPISPRAFLSGRAFDILANEFVWVWLPAISVALLCRWIFSGKRSQAVPHGPDLPRRS